jgi:low temperature requirement protein LtrA
MLCCMARLSGPRRVQSPDAAAPVTMLELFFDLVFVFTVTQLTTVVTNTHTALGFVQAGTVLFVIWWMYDGYCWLSNNVGPTSTSTRLPMLFAMAAFLVLAIAVPEAYGKDAWLFAAAYLGVVIVHAVSFLRSTLGGSARAMLAIAPVNLGAAALLFVAAALPHDLRWIAWIGAVALFVAAMVTQRESGFSIRPVHFAERHRLLLIIALGESVIAIGVSAEGHIAAARYLVAVLLAMLLIALFWWIHFADDESATEALLRIERDDPGRLVRVAMFAFSMSYLLLVAGLIPVASGLHEVVHDPGHHLSWLAAGTLGVGTAIYLVGNSVHLWLLGLSGGWALKGAALVCLATIPLGHEVTGDAQVVALCLVLGAALAASGRATHHPMHQVA